MPVDREARVIRGYKVMSLGEALGHGVVVDETTLNQLVELGNKGDVKSKVQHRNGSTDGFGRYLGKSRNFRREGDSAVADLHLDDLAFKSPEGDWGSYLLDLADRAPDAFGASPEVIEHRIPMNGSKPVMRLKQLLAIAIVDRPATNVGFFSVLGDSDMAEVTALEAQVAELSAERDNATKKAGELQAQLIELQAKIKEAAAGEAAALSAARIEATAVALKSERERAGDILALCSKANKTDLSAKFIADGTSTSEVQASLFAALCAGAKPLGDSSTNLESGKDENSAYKAEYTALSAKDRSTFGTEAEYVAMRRVDDGLDVLTVGSAAK